MSQQQQQQQQQQQHQQQQQEQQEQETRQQQRQQDLLASLSVSLPPINTSVTKAASQGDPSSGRHGVRHEDVLISLPGSHILNPTPGTSLSRTLTPCKLHMFTSDPALTLPLQASGQTNHAPDLDSVPAQALYDVYRVWVARLLLASQ